MLEVKNAVKTFDGFAALDGVDVTVPDGAVYGLVGPNGAGKSTLIRCLTGIYRQDSGEVLVEGEPVYENPGKKALIAAIPDDWFYFPSATIRDMMRFYRGMYPAFDTDRYERFKEVFPIPEKAVIRRLSKGMQKQAAFWLTMCCRPRYLILDEPVDGLDPVMRRQVWSLMMADVDEYNTTVLVSSHNLRELEDVCDHVGIMNQGKVLIQRSLSDLQQNIVKMQAVWSAEETPQLPADLPVLHTSHVGRVYTYIIRGSSEDITNRLSVYSPLMLEALPLSLEEIFIYELGGAQYAVKEIVL
ncbi:MAG: ABC transporter ATP-binding protein [Oscillospiraceae bacterium]|jgi:ABC-2 type transport system ATP-binding protein|nr:ABC transporter ATP-binding protein [Oscillospiraceae bacterium]